MTEAEAASAAEKLIERRTNDAGAAQRAEFTRQRAELRQEDVKQARRELLAARLDLERLDAVAPHRERDYRTLAETTYRRAIEDSEDAARRLRALTPERIAPVTMQQVVLDKALFIRSFVDSGTVSDSGTAPGDNWAQYRFKNREHGRLSFFTLWQNPKDRTAFTSAAARLMVNAHLSVYAGGTGIAAWLVGFDISSKATVRARTTLHALWSADMPVVGDETILGEVEANAGFSSDSDSMPIQFNELLAAPAIAVPKHEYLLIEVELLTEHSGDEVDFDAESGAFRVDQPTIDLTLTL